MEMIGKQALKTEKQGRQTKVACAWLVWFHEVRDVLNDAKLVQESQEFVTRMKGLNDSK